MSNIFSIIGCLEPEGSGNAFGILVNRFQVMLSAMQLLLSWL